MLAFGLLLPRAHAQAPIGHIPPPTVADIQAYASQQALNASLSPDMVQKVIGCESGWDAAAVGDHGHSYGLVQIYLNAHLEVNKQDALNPYFAVDFLIHEWKAGRAREWTCARILGY